MASQSTPRKLLSIDGGGVRGLSALILLEQLMDMANDLREKQNLEKQEPWEMFDMIGGTSTGGLIAIMLGRLKMSLKDCIQAYKELSGDIFTKRNFASRVVAKGTLGPIFNEKPFEAAIKAVVKTRLGDEEALLWTKEKGCKVFVIAHFNETEGEAAILRSYRNINKPKQQLEIMQIWQACRATSASLTFFEPIVVDDRTYSDGGLLHNNPVGHVHAEASTMFENSETILISLGTGTVGTTEFDPNPVTIAKALARIATDTKRSSELYASRDDGKATDMGKYFRFNVPGLGSIGLDEAERMKDIRNQTEIYLNEAEVGKKAKRAAEMISRSESLSIVTTVPSLSGADELQERLQMLRH